MIYKPHLTHLITETLNEVGLYSENALQLLLGTAAQESAFGKYLKQLDNGPAKGIFQMEPATHDYLVREFLRLKPTLFKKIVKACNINTMHHDALVYNLKYAICMSRVRYLIVPEFLPGAEDIMGQAKYWKKYYNTHLGKGTVQEFIHNYKKYVL